MVLFVRDAEVMVHGTLHAVIGELQLLLIVQLNVEVEAEVVVVAAVIQVKVVANVAAMLVPRLHHSCTMVKIGIVRIWGTVLTVVLA